METIEAVKEETKHTPTPWAVKEGWPLVIIPLSEAHKPLGTSSNEKRDREDFAHPIVSAEHNPFLSFAHRTSRGEAIANAEFIVRACNLHDELVTVLQLIMRDLPTRRDWLDPVVEEMARAAIKKAEGQ
jgi:hypothetical protein